MNIACLQFTFLSDKIFILFYLYIPQFKDVNHFKEIAFEHTL